MSQGEVSPPAGVRLPLDGVDLILDYPFFPTVTILTVISKLTLLG